MTQTKDEALKLALEALEYRGGSTWLKHDIAVEAIKAALAQPAQEPVAWMTPDGEGFRIRFSPPTNDVPLGWDALYTTPQQRPWVGLTKAQFLEATRLAENGNYLVAFVRIQAWLKEGNA